MTQNAKTIGIVAAAVVLAAALGFGVARSGPVLGQSFSVGYVDMARALDAHPRRASAEAALKDYAQSQAADMRQRAKGLNAAQQEDLQRQYGQQVLKKRQELLGGLEKDIRGAIDKIAKGQGVSVVLTREVVLYGGVDLTDQVVKAVAGK